MRGKSLRPSDRAARTSSKDRSPLTLPLGGAVQKCSQQGVDDAVGPVPRLDDVEALVDLALQAAVAQVAGHEDGALGAADLDHGLVGGVDGVGAGEPAQDGLGGGGAGPDRGGVLDHLVVLLGDDVPADRAGQRRTFLDGTV